MSAEQPRRLHRKLPELFIGDHVQLWQGDCREVMQRLEANSIDAAITDPPYHLASIVKRFGKADIEDGTKTSQRSRDRSDGMARLTRGFHGQSWDDGDIAFRPGVWGKLWRVLKPGAHLVAFGHTTNYHRLATAIEMAGFEIRDAVSWLYSSGFPKSHSVEKNLRKAGSEEAQEWAGWGTALKPAAEIICLARKPLSEPTVAANVLRWGTGALNIDATRCEGGRWPANLVHDGSEEVLSLFPFAEDGGPRVGEGGSAARFFYSSKATTEERLGSNHPTVKPVDLMQWLVRLVTPKGGTIIDPFAGTGTTGEAAWRETRKAILIEQSQEYAEDLRRRMELAMAGKVERQHARIKAAGLVDLNAGPLFDGLIDV